MASCRWYRACDADEDAGAARIVAAVQPGKRSWAASHDATGRVPPDANLPETRKALAHDRDVTVRELPGLNHLFQTAETGAPAEYGKIDETMSPAVLTLVSDWIARHSS